MLKFDAIEPPAPQGKALRWSFLERLTRRHRSWRMPALKDFDVNREICLGVFADGCD
jgi:hypothetical protein